MKLNINTHLLNRINGYCLKYNLNKVDTSIYVIYYDMYKYQNVKTILYLH